MKEQIKKETGRLDGRASRDRVSERSTSASTTTQRRGAAYLDRSRAGKAGWPVSKAPIYLTGLLAAGLIGGGSLWRVNQVQDQLQASTISELRSEYGVELSSGDVDFDYRDGTVALDLPAGAATETEIEEFLSSRLNDGELGNLRTVEVTVNEVPIEEPAAAATGMLDVTAVGDGQQITLEGQVLNRAQSDELQAAATAAVGESNVVNKLTVLDLDEATAGSDARVAGLASVLSQFDDENVVAISAHLDDTELTISGEATNDAAAQTLAGATASGADGAGVASSSAITAAPPVTTTQILPEEVLAEEVVALQAELDALQAEIIENVVFATNRFDISPTAATTLDKVADAMDRYPLPSVRVGGHTDADGNDANNLELSDQRAKAVAAYIVDKGIPPGRLLGEGFGETDPVAPNDSPENKQRNRRVAFTAVGEFVN